MKENQPGTKEMATLAFNVKSCKVKFIETEQKVVAGVWEVRKEEIVV